MKKRIKTRDTNFRAMLAVGPRWHEAVKNEAVRQGRKLQQVTEAILAEGLPRVQEKNPEAAPRLP